MTETRPPTPAERATGLLNISTYADELRAATLDALMAVLLPHTGYDEQAELLEQLASLLDMEAAETAAGLSGASEWRAEAEAVAARAIAADDLSASEVAR